MQKEITPDETVDPKEFLQKRRIMVTEAEAEELIKCGQDGRCGVTFKELKDWRDELRSQLCEELQKDLERRCEERTRPTRDIWLTAQLVRRYPQKRGAQKLKKPSPDRSRDEPNSMAGGGYHSTLRKGVGQREGAINQIPR